MSDINCHGEITPRPRIELATPGLKIRCSPNLVNRTDFCGDQWPTYLANLNNRPVSFCTINKILENEHTALYGETYYYSDKRLLWSYTYPLALFHYSLSQQNNRELRKKNVCSLFIG